MTETNTETPAKSAPTATLPFPIASRAMTRFSEQVTAPLSGAGVTPLAPIQLPAVGYLRRLQLKVDVTTTAGTGFLDDGPFNILSRVSFDTAAGNNIVVPYTGYELYLLNKYGHPTVPAPYADPKYIAYSTTSGTAATFYLDIPFELDSETAWGSIPALASNRSYKLNISLAPYTVVTAATGGSVTITAVAHYWSEPPAQSASGISQDTQPMGLGTVSQWQLDSHSVTPGDKLLKLSNVGNFMRSVIFVSRTAAGARTSVNWPALTELYLDNEPMMYLPKADWERYMRQWFGLASTGADTANGLDTGVYVIPFNALVGATSGNVTNSRSQYLPTLDSSQLQIRGQNFGAAISSVSIMTNSVVPTTSADVYSK